MVAKVGYALQGFAAVLLAALPAPAGAAQADRPTTQATSQPALGQTPRAWATGGPFARGPYNLCRPVPADQMGPLETDRPDQTEGPFTAPPGHLQIESGLASYSFSDHGGRRQLVDLFDTNFRLGLLPAWEFDAITQPFLWQRDHPSGQPADEEHGYGDTTFRIKWNLWGNGGKDKTAFALLPSITVPTSQDHLGAPSVEAGLLLPLQINFTKHTVLAAMTGFEALRDERGSGYHLDPINSLALHHDLSDKLNVYAEFFSEVTTERPSEWIGTVDFGALYLLAPNVQLDAGINVGVTPGADDLNPFIGLSWRF